MLFEACRTTPSAGAGIAIVCTCSGSFSLPARPVSATTNPPGKTFAPPDSAPWRNGSTCRNEPPPTGTCRVASGPPPGRRMSIRVRAGAVVEPWTTSVPAPMLARHFTFSRGARRLAPTAAPVPFAENTAVTVFAFDATTSHVASLPAHEPVHFLKAYPAAGFAVSVSSAPGATSP